MICLLTQTGLTLQPAHTFNTLPLILAHLHTFRDFANTKHTNADTVID